MNKIIIANWKMNLRFNESQKLLTAFATKIKPKNCEVVVCPSFIALDSAQQIFKKTKLTLGAQDVFWRDDGPFTGEVSTSDLLNLNCKYVIIGHSERRQNLEETDAMVNLKIKAALAISLTPIVCVGETLAQKEADQRLEVLQKQIVNGFQEVKLAPGQKIIIAYEPIWAIGSGQVCPASVADDVQQFIKTLIRKNIGLTDEQVMTVYGGSVNADNAGELLQQPSIDGLLVGGASLNVEVFNKIVNQ